MRTCMRHYLVTLNLNSDFTPPIQCYGEVRRPLKATCTAGRVANPEFPNKDRYTKYNIL
jgi:hypothetical protein